MTPDISAATPRNAPCPCGSGLRYKSCHGAPLAFDAAAAAANPSVQDAAQLRRAWSCIENGDWFTAETLCHDILTRTSDQPEALCIAGCAHSRRSEPREALRYLLAATRSPSLPALAADAQFRVWSSFSQGFIETMFGMDHAQALRKQAEYDALQSNGSAGAPASATAPLVSAVLVLSRNDLLPSVTLTSLMRQNYLPLELIVVHGYTHSEDVDRLMSQLRNCPAQCCVTAMPATSGVAMLNAGIRAAKGDYVGVVAAGDVWAADRIGALVVNVATRGEAWGFGRVELAATAGGDATNQQTRDASERISDADTIGFTLIHQRFAIVGAGNLFFSRDLFDELDGFRDLPHVHAWDFCLRALWHAEPRYVASALLEASPPGDDGRQQLEREQEQIAMFAEFYQRACSPHAIGANTFAPCRAGWGLSFVRRVLEVGHVLAIPPSLLGDIAAEVGERIDAQRKLPRTAGIDLVGFALGEFGLGENLRALARACIAGAIPMSVRDVAMRLKASQGDRSILANVVDEFRHRCAVFCMNPDTLTLVWPKLMAGASAQQYNVGYWFWELEEIPRAWLASLDEVDEVWVATEFIRAAVQRATTKPVTKIPTPVVPQVERAYRRADFGLPGDRFLFLFSFDFNGFPLRKNPEAVLMAFRRAFPRGRNDVGLVIKSINGRNRPDDLARIEALIGGDPRIVSIDRRFTRDEVFGLQQVVDCYVSLHRAEGLGLGLAESMYFGKPAIATRYSGNLEFMNAQNSCLVDFHLIPVARGAYPIDHGGQIWADPDVDHAAHWMARVVDDVDFRTRIAQQGQADIRSRFTYANAAALMRGRLEELGLI